ncbi:MAG: hypothetical protein IJX97_02805 [Clostridia bacterium]|nr:hypothetical protein [Clostridia bacterium]
MRNLTVKRDKSFVGCLAKIHIYIEDPSGELTINNVACRKLGELKNGCEATFEIEESATRIFAIADKMSKDYCFDCYYIGEGKGDESLSGRCKFNPAVGNAFRFDGNETVVTASDRKKGAKLGLIVLVASILVGAMLGFGVTSIIFDNINSEEKVFHAGNMSITLNKGFTQQNISGYSAVYASKKVAVFVKYYPDVESFAELTAIDFATVLAEDIGLPEDIVESKGDLTYFSYTGTQSDGKLYRYYAYSYKDDDDFWLIQFSVKESAAKRYQDDIEKWADSVAFSH